MKMQVYAAVLVLALIAGPTHARNLQQQFSSASAVSNSGGSGPNGNCGSTSTVGNAQAFASGPPCPGPTPAAPTTPTPATPAPSTTPAANPACPASTVVVNWGTQATYPPITACPGSGIQFKWNTQSASQLFGLYQIPSTTCPASATADGVQLRITPASSPNPAGYDTITISDPGTYYFTDIPNCSKGQLQAVTISTTPPPAAGASANAQSSAQATAGKKL